MQADRVVIDILGTYSNGTFIANIRFEGKTFCAYYPAHLRNVLILHNLLRQGIESLLLAYCVENDADGCEKHSRNRPDDPCFGDSCEIHD